MRRYAEDTQVSVGKSRGQIDDLLRDWGATGVRWTDDFSTGNIVLEFTWTYEEAPLAARYVVKLPDDEALKKRARHGRTGYFLPTKFEKLKASRGRPEMRQLFLLIKAKLNAVESGLVSAEDEFLAHFIGKDGRTVGEAFIERLPSLIQSSAAGFLTEGPR